MFKFKNPAKPVQLVKHFEDVKKSDLLYPAYCEVKEDGVYAAFYKDPETSALTILSRTGKEFYSELTRVLEENKILQHIPQGYVTICEVINDSLSLEELSGLVNPNRVNAWTTLQWSQMVASTEFVVHDLIPIEDFFTGYCPRTFNHRHNLLREYYPKEFCTTGWVVFSEEGFRARAEYVIKEGGEGVVMKQLRAPWIAGHKGHHAVKLVRGVSYDLECTGVTLGKGKREGYIGALHFTLNGKDFKADLGAGWTDERRVELTAQYLNDKTTVVGKVFKVVALQESSKGVLRLPKVEEMRIDKTEADNV